MTGTFVFYNFRDSNQSSLDNLNKFRTSEAIMDTEFAPAKSTLELGNLKDTKLEAVDVNMNQEPKTMDWLKVPAIEELKIMPINRAISVESLIEQR